VRRAGLVVFLVALTLSACASGNASSTTTTGASSRHGSSTTTSGATTPHGSATTTSSDASRHSGTTTTSGGGSAKNSPTTALSGGAATNVSPCNYAQAWYDDPSIFSEFTTVASLAQKASDAGLRSEGRQLAADATAQNTAGADSVMSALFTTCRQLGLATTSGSHRTLG
jgi:hypothetical protein